MRVDAFVSMTATAEYWDFTTTQDPISLKNINVYSMSRDISLIVNENSGQSFAFTRELLKFSAQLRNVKDRSGNPIWDTDTLQTIVYLGTPVAQLDVFGNVAGYKYQLSRTTMGVAS